MTTRAEQQRDANIAAAADALGRIAEASEALVKHVEEVAERLEVVCVVVTDMGRRLEMVQARPDIRYPSGAE